MSFRELRNFTEIMKSLGYPRLISMENFRTPNFELVADSIHWLVKRYDPAVELSDDISTETDRVIFLKSVAQIMLTRARIKLNIKRLYSADGLAVKELLKIASMLYQATVKDDGDDREDSGGADMGFSAKALDVKLTRGLASEITQVGAHLYDALEEELELREARNRAIQRQMDTDEIERSVKEAISSVNENVGQVQRMLENLEKDEKNLDAKIEKRKSELERSEKRLSTLQSVRPAYMDEYERLQEDLQNLYANYLEKFRNMQYLEHELEIYRKMEEEKMEESDRHLKKMQKRLRDEELRILRGEAQVDEAGIKDDDDDDDDDSIEIGSPDGKPAKGRGGGDKRPGAATIKRGTGGLGGKGGRVHGSMKGGHDEDSDDLDALSDGGTDSTHVSLNEEGESSGDDLIEDDDDDELSDVDEIGGDDSQASSDNEF